MKRTAALLAALVLGGILPAADSTTETRIDLVAIDARGRPIERLTAADVKVLEAGVALPVSDVRFVRSTGAADAESAPPRVVGIFLDEFHVTPGPAADAVRDALAAFVENDIGPADLVTVVKPLDSLVSIALTANRSAALDAIRGFAPRRDDLTARTEFEQQFIAGSPAQIELSRAQISTSALTALARAAGRATDGRKTVIVVSEGIARSTPRRGEALQPGLEAVTAAANRSHVAIYPIDLTSGAPTATGHAGPDAQTESDALALAAFTRLASTTAGQLIARGQVSAGLRQALVDNSAYFVLTIASPTAPGDGRLHDVAVTPATANLRIRARGAYWLPAPAPVPKPPAFGTAAAGLPRRTSPLIQTWYGMTRGDNGTTRVSFSWEPARLNTTRLPVERGAVVPQPVRVQMSVTALDGTVLYQGAVRPSTRTSFDAPAGRVLVQIAVEDAGARVLDRDIRDVVISDVAARAAIGSPEILRARNARELANLRADSSAAPVASRVFSRTETLLVRVPLLGTSPSELTATLVSRMGSTLRTLTASPVDDRDGVFEFDLPLAPFASGDYTIQLRASIDGHAVEDRVAFRLTP